jgi:hypothetical protein
MRVTQKAALSPAAIEIGLLALALLWYWWCGVLLYSRENGLDSIPWPWLLIVASGPLLSAVLALASKRMPFVILTLPVAAGAYFLDPERGLIRLGFRMQQTGASGSG